MSFSSRLLTDVEFAALDLETTGLHPVVCRIVEFGAVRFTLAEGELGRFEQLVDPECPIPRDVIRVHGITNAMVRGMPTVAETLPRFLEFLAGSNTVLLAHNASFDLGFLRFALAKSGLAPPATPVLDTLDLSRKYVRGLYHHGLENVARFLRVAESEDHRALSDARLAMGVFRTIVRRSRRLKTIGDLFGISPPLGFEEADGPALQPPPGCEDLDVAIREEKTVVVVYEGGTRGPVERRITPRVLVRSGGRVYLTAYCHIDRIDKTYRVDRIRQLRFEE